MSDKKYVVPEGMLKAATVAYNAKTCSMGYKYVIDRNVTEATLEAALRWLDDELAKMVKRREGSEYFYRSPSMADDYLEQGCNQAIHAVRRIFAAPEPEVPEAIKYLLLQGHLDPLPGRKVYNNRILEAYRRGREGK